MVEPDLYWEMIEQPKAIQLLTGPSWTYFQPFLARAATVAQVADELQVAPNKLLYHVKKAEQLGLLKVVDIQRRAGKPIKTYRSSADMYFIPFEATPAETLEASILPLDTDWQARWTHHAAEIMLKSEIPFGLRLWRERVGQQDMVIVKPTPAPPTPINEDLFQQLPILSLWAEFQLTKEESEHLRHDLLELYERYTRLSARHSSTAETHLVHLAITPVCKKP